MEVKLRTVYNHLGREINLEDMLEIGEGWKPILRNLYDQLVDLGWDRVVLQIKQKFAGLRFYVYSLNDEQRELVDKAVALCDVTCETCGELGTLYNRRGWYVIACKKHAKPLPRDW